MPQQPSNRTGIRIAVGAALVFAAFGSSCRVGDEIVKFTIKVDSLQADTIVAGSFIDVQFFGHIGPDLCWMLEGITRERTDDKFEVRFRGQRVVRGDCPQTPNELDHLERLPQPFNDPFKVIVQQPDGSKLEVTVPRK